MRRAPGVLATIALAGLLVGAASSCLSTAGLSGGGEESDAAVLPDVPDPNPCGADLQNDKVNCGKCGTVCPLNANSYPECKAGKCTIACNSGFGNCDGDDANGCEAALSNDPNNCNKCGRSCFGGACSLGQCAPVVIANVNGRATGIAVDDTSLYYGFLGSATNTAGIVRIDKDGKQAPQSVVTPTQREVYEIVSDATSLYWAVSNTTSPPTAADGAIYKVAKNATNGTPTAVATGVAGYYTYTHLAVDAQNVYFTAYGRYDSTSATYVGGGVYKCAVAGCGAAPTVLASTPRHPAGIAVDATTLFFGTAGDGTAGSAAVYKCSLGGCGTSLPTTPFLSLTSVPWALTLDGTNAYVATDTVVLKATKAAGDTTTLASAQRSPRDIAVDATTVYWPSYIGNTVASCGIGGCNGTPQILASQNVSYPFFIAVDDKAIYWTNYSSSATSTVMKVAK